MIFRYHVPAHIQKHIDYITPGIKLFTTGKSNPPAFRDDEQERSDSDLSKRDFKLPIFVKGLAARILTVLMTSPLSLELCDVAATPACIQSMI